MAIKRYVGMGKETGSFGSAVAATRYAEAKASFKPNPNWIIPSPIASREFRKRNLGPYRTRGAIGDFDVEPENIIGELLLGVFGSVNTSTPTSGVKLHEFVPADTLPSYTTRLGVEQTERVLPGCLIEALTVRFPHDNNVKAQAAVLSGFVETKASLATPTLSELQALVFPSGGGTLTIEAADKKALIYDIEVTVKNNIPFDRGALDGRTFSVKRYGQREVTGKISAYFDDTTEYDRFIAGNEFKIIVQVDGPVISGAYKYYLKFELRKCVYLRDLAPDVTPINEPLVVDAPFKAFYDETGGFNAEVKAWLENTIASY